MQSALLWCALGFYGLGILLALPSMMRRRPSLPSSTLAAVAVGLAWHAIALLTLARAVHRLPAIDVESAISLLAFGVTLAFFVTYLRYRITSLGIFMLPFSFFLTLLAASPRGRPADFRPFSNTWIVIHVSAMIAGYTALFLTFVAAIMYLIQERELKSKAPRAFYYRLPSLEVCDQLYYRSLVLGLFLLTLGILTGFVWASRAWRGPWELDPKILASLAVWIIYLVLFSTRYSGNWRGRRLAYGAILGFAVIMVTFLGVTFVSRQHGFLPMSGRMP